MADYQARVAVEGEYDEQELPPSMLDELEASQGPDKAAFAVSMQGGMAEQRAGVGAPRTVGCLWDAHRCLCCTCRRMLRSILYVVPAELPGCSFAVGWLWAYIL